MTTPPARFGTSFSEHMAIARYQNGQWSDFEITPTAPLSIHPGCHVLHYASAIFEGFKVFRNVNGGIHVFRMDAHVARMQQSAGLLYLPEPPAALLSQMIVDLAVKCRDDVPEFPGSLYIRPNLFGTQVDIGAAATPSEEACLTVLASPVGDYFAGGMRPLKVLIEPQMRTAAHLGVVKTGANYASALYNVMRAKQEYGADQVLFCPNDDVQETGATNFLLLRDGEVLTKHLDTTYLHGVTRDSLLTMARDSGMSVEERAISVAEVLDWVKTGEAALSGTAAVLAGVGSIVHNGVEHPVNGGQIGPVTEQLRGALIELQSGASEDKHGWLTKLAD